MTRRRDDLIAELAQGLRPVRRALAPATFALAWLAGAWLFSVGFLAAGGPMRPGWLAQLAAHPRLQLEFLLGFAAGGLAILGAAQLTVPSPRPVSARATPVLGLLAAWSATCLWALWDLPVPASMAGKREHCYAEILVCAAPLAVAGFWLARRAAPLARTWTGALLGIASASIPAVWMQLACIYDPAHILVFHLAPVGAVAIVATVLGLIALRRI